MAIITSLDIDEFNKRFVSKDYPCIVIEKPSDPLVLTLNVLIKGDMPLIVSYNGQQIEIARIDISAYNILMLLEVLDELIFVDLNQQAHVIKTVPEYLEVI